MTLIQKLMIITLSLLTMVAVAVPVTASPEPRGPLNQENRFPAMLMFLTPKPDTPSMVEQGKIKTGISLDYTSVHVVKQSASWDVLVDMELAVITPEIEFRPFRRLSISATLPFVSMNDGFLDAPLDAYHDAGNFPDYGRSERPENEFAYSISRNGEDWFHSEKGGLHLTDSTLSLKYALSGDQGSEISTALSYSIKFPFGDETHGFGSGGTDHAFTLLTRIRKDPWVVYLNPGIIIPEDPVTQGADISVDPMTTLFGGIEFLYGDKCSLVAQLNCFSSPFEDTGIGPLDNPTVELTFGFIYQLLPELTIELAFSEDLSGTLPDFTLHSALNWTIGF